MLSLDRKSVKARKWLEDLREWLLHPGIHLAQAMFFEVDRQEERLVDWLDLKSAESTCYNRFKHP